MTYQFSTCRVVASLLLIIAALLSGCARSPEPFSYEIVVRAKDTEMGIAGADIRAEIGVRDVYQATSSADGTAQLTIEGEHLGGWAKIVVEADDYQQASILVKLEEANLSASIGLDPISAETNTEGSLSQSPASTNGKTSDANDASPVVSETMTQAEAIDSEDGSFQDGGTVPLQFAEIAPADRADYYQARPPLTIDADKSYQATIQTNKGDIVLLLDAEAAPEHVNNFIFLSNQGFYNGLTFHRVEPGFVIQGGDPLGDGSGGPGYTIPGEFELTHIEGALAMARRPDSVNPDRESSGSQFYITLAPTEFLDGDYTVFGHVEAGMDVVNSIEIGDTIERIVVEP